MQPARIKLHAKEHTNNPVQRPHFRGHAGTMELELESFYSITTFIRAMTSLLQIRQVAHLTEHHMQPARIKPHAEGAHKQPRPET
jgi:hypothetical protein